MSINEHPSSQHDDDSGLRLDDRNRRLIAEIEEREAHLPELKAQLVRAESWNQLFASPEEEIEDYLRSIVGNFLEEYEGNESLREHRVETDEDGDLHVFERTTPGVYSTARKRTSDGNVELGFHNSSADEPHTDLIIPQAGNINHDFSSDNTKIPNYEDMDQLSDEEFESITGTGKIQMTLYLRGKPATEKWEETMLLNGHTPQRIGHTIFPGFALEAQARLLEARPDLFNSR